jgi:4-hydroxybenzoate polyprenyltransferase
MSEIKNRSGLWYLLPLIFGIIGGVIAWFVIKDDDPKKAKNCFYLGLVLLIIEILFGFTLF